LKTLANGSCKIGVTTSLLADDHWFLEDGKITSNNAAANTPAAVSFQKARFLARFVTA
jgi:hypothetical protein